MKKIFIIGIIAILVLSFGVIGATDFCSNCDIVKVLKEILNALKDLRKCDFETVNTEIAIPTFFGNSSIDITFVFPPQNLFYEKFEIQEVNARVTCKINSTTADACIYQLNENGCLTVPKGSDDFFDLSSCIPFYNAGINRHILIPNNNATDFSGIRKMSDYLIEAKIKPANC